MTMEYTEKKEYTVESELHLGIYKPKLHQKLMAVWYMPSQIKHSTMIVPEESQSYLTTIIYQTIADYILCQELDNPGNIHMSRYKKLSWKKKNQKRFPFEILMHIKQTVLPETKAVLTY